MTLIRRTNPFGELISLRHAMDRLFEDAFIRPDNGQTESEHQLALDVRSAGDSLVVEAALPGIRPEDVEISVLGDTLTIKGSHATDESRTHDGYSYREIRRGTFSRTLTLPTGLKPDAATASFENGMLTLSIPKAEESRPQQIRITPNGASHNGRADTSPAHGDGAENGA